MNVDMLRQINIFSELRDAPGWYRIFIADSTDPGNLEACSGSAEILSKCLNKRDTCVRVGDERFNRMLIRSMRVQAVTITPMILIMPQVLRLKMQFPFKLSKSRPADVIAVERTRHDLGTDLSRMLDRKFLVLSHMLVCSGRVYSCTDISTNSRFRREDKQAWLPQPLA